MRRLINHARKETMITLPGLDNIATGSGTSTPAPAAEESDVPQQAIPRNRKERRQADKQEAKEAKDPKSKSKGGKAAKAPAVTPPTGQSVPKKRVMAPNGRLLLVDPAGNVYMEQREQVDDDKYETHEILLDASCPFFTLLHVCCEFHTSFSKSTPTKKH